MREVRYRGRDVDTGQWVVGYGVIITPPIHIKDKPDIEPQACIVHRQGKNLMQHTEVTVESVAQWTGLNFLKKPKHTGDCPLFDIYENSTGVSPKDDKFWACVFKDGGFRWQRVTVDRHKHPSEYRWANEFRDISADMYDGGGTIHECNFIEE